MDDSRSEKHSHKMVSIYNLDLEYWSYKGWKYILFNLWRIRLYRIKLNNILWWMWCNSSLRMLSCCKFRSKMVLPKMFSIKWWQRLIDQLLILSRTILNSRISLNKWSIIMGI